MNYAQEIKKVNNLTPPFQPEMNANVKQYREQMIRWNPQGLKKQALCYEFMTGTEAHTITFVPDACCNILIACDESAPESWVSGMISEPLKLELKPDTTYFGIKPYSNVAIRENKVQLQELSHEAEELWRVFDNTDLLLDRILKQDDFQKRIQIFEKYAEKEMIDYTYKSDFVDYFMMLSCVSDEDVVFRNLVEETGYSQRYLRQKFKENTGISPKIYTSVLRFQHVLKDYLKRTIPETNHFFLDYGYYDQAHFIKEFKKYTSCSPVQYRKEYLKKIENPV